MRRTLSCLLFVLAVIAFTFTSTFVHEMGHALAWDATTMPDVVMADSRDEARTAIAQESRRDIDGKAYRVMEVERTTIALYPKTILAVGATLCIAPGGMLPDDVLASTFYALEDEHYRTLATGKDPTGWQEAATPMIVNGFLAIPVWIWLLRRPGPVSMAAAWVNAAEWRFNVHHAEEVGLPAAVYLGFSLIAMAAVAATITYHAMGGRASRRLPPPAVPAQGPSLPAGAAQAARAPATVQAPALAATRPSPVARPSLGPSPPMPPPASMHTRKARASMPAPPAPSRLQRPGPPPRAATRPAGATPSSARRTVGDGS